MTTDAEEEICQALKKRFEEHLLRKYPDIDKFNPDHDKFNFNTRRTTIAFSKIIPRHPFYHSLKKQL